jgi:ketosteroid isomerase-like protein
MASADFNLVRSIFAAWERGDFSSAEWAHPEIEFVITGGPVEGSWTGRAAMAEGFRHFLNAWDVLRLEADEYCEVDDERVLVVIRLRGRGKTSGLELRQIPGRGAGLFHLRHGKVTRYVIYWDYERARADLGLAPEGGSAQS